MKEIYVESCEKCPNIRKMAISVYCVLNGAQNQLALDYKIPDWCPLQNHILKPQTEIEDRLRKYKFDYQLWHEQNPMSESARLLLLRIHELEWVLSNE